MLLKVILTILAAVVALSAPAAQGKDAAQGLRHSQSVVQFFENHSWMLAKRKDKCKEVPWQRTCTIARRLYTKHLKLIPVWQARMIPVGEAQIRAYIYRTYGRSEGECMATIIQWENVVWDPTVDYGFGHGNVYEAYGLPQANPGTKMASAGPDWRTNPITQLKWMHSYSVQRYGSLCGAFQHRRDYHMY
jgi:hypothetical protein